MPNDTIEKQKIEQDAGGNIEGKKKNIPEKSTHSELLNLKADIIKKNADSITKKEGQEADELVNDIPGIQKERQKETTAAQMNITETIKNLNRPQAQQGLEQAYTNMDTTIKASKDDTGIAGVLGKIINRINPSA